MNTTGMKNAIRPGLLAAALAAVAVALPAGADAAAPKLVATVGPGYSISVRTASGAVARNVKPGVYQIVVRDRSAEHNFHLSGSGINKSTSVGWTGTKTWTVRLARGKSYRFVCDPHAGEMFGSFKVR
jgi:plastocyanin